MIEKKYSKKEISSIEKFIKKSREGANAAEEVLKSMEQQNWQIKWMTPFDVDEKEMAKLGYKNYNKLPLPRFEMRITQHEQRPEWVVYLYGLVYKHLMGNIVFVPFGQTEGQGSNTYASMKKRISTPFRDGVNLPVEARMLGLENFVLFEGTITSYEDLYEQGFDSKEQCQEFVQQRAGRLIRSNTYNK